MQLSRKSEYALQALIYIAAVNGQKTSSINEIAENAGIPREYLAKVLKGLTNRGLLVSSKGVNGGYRLAKSRDRISFLDILEATQGPFRIIHFNDKDHNPAFAFWEDIRKSLKKTLTEMNLGKIDFSKYYNKVKK